MKINIPFLKVPLVVTSVFLLLAVYPYRPDGFWVLLRIITFLSSLYLVARAISINRFFWAWLMAGIAVLYNPVFTVFINRKRMLGEVFVDYDIPGVLSVAVFVIYLIAWLCLSGDTIDKRKKYLRVFTKVLSKTLLGLFVAIMIFVGILFVKGYLEKKQKEAKRLEINRVLNVSMFPDQTLAEPKTQSIDKTDIDLSKLPVQSSKSNGSTFDLKSARAVEGTIKGRKWELTQPDGTVKEGIINKADRVKLFKDTPNPTIEIEGVVYDAVPSSWYLLKPKYEEVDLGKLFGPPDAIQQTANSK